MKNPLKFLPILITLPILAHISCANSDVPDLPPVGGLSSSSEDRSSSSSSSITSDTVLCIVGSNCQYVPKNACDAFNGTQVSSCPVSSSSSGISNASSSSGDVSLAAKYCYNTLGYNECIIIGIINELAYYWLNTDDCELDGGTVVERAWCVESGYLVIDE